MIKLCVKKEFVSGNLKGLFYNDVIKFFDVRAVFDWLDAVKENLEFGYVDYKIVDYYLVK